MGPIWKDVERKFNMKDKSECMYFHDFYSNGIMLSESLLYWVFLILLFSNTELGHRDRKPESACASV